MRETPKAAAMLLLFRSDPNQKIIVMAALVAAIHFPEALGL
jgi:hypothetical protein